MCLTEIKKTSAKTYEEDDDEILFDVVGNYGPWQRDIFIIFFLINVIGVWQNLAVTFLAPNQDFLCVDVDYGNKNVTGFPWTPNSTKFKNYFNRTNNQCQLVIPTGNNGSEEIFRCTKWEYDTSVTSETIVSEWDLVCGREWMVSFAKSIYMIGFLTSVLIFGQFADSFGRFLTILVCWVIACISGILSVFSTSYLMFIVLRFLMAFGRTGLTTTGYVIVMEIVGPKWRTELGIAIQVGWAVGFSTLPAVAYFARHWVHLSLVLSVPTIPFVCVYWLVPETPRWLMTQNKRKQFESVIVKAAKKNNREIKDVANILPFSQIKFNSQDTLVTKKTTFIDMVRTPQMRKRSINMALLWTVNAYVYYSLSYNTNDLGGNPYLNFFLSGVMELISYVFVYISIKKWGRKLPTLIGMIIGGIACAGVIPIPEDLNWLSITFSMVGKLCITGTFGILYLYTTELFPTVIRNLSIGACSTCARVGSIVAPFGRELGKATYSWTPNALNAVLSIATGLLLLFLPETRGRRIPDTLEEAEGYVKDHPKSSGEVKNTHVESSML